MLIHLFCKCLLALRKNHALAPCLSPGHKQTPYMRNLTSHRSWGWKAWDQRTGTQWKNSCCAIPLCEAEGQERVRESKGSTGTTVEGFNFQIRTGSSVPRSAEILGCYCLGQEATCPDVWECLLKELEKNGGGGETTVINNSKKEGSSQRTNRKFMTSS